MARPMEPTTTGSARLRKRELFAALGYQPHDGQVLVHRSKASRRILACGARWGKSTCGSMEAIAGIFELRERTLGWLVAPTLDLTRILFDEVVRAVDQHLKHRIVVCDTREQRIVVRNFAGGIGELRAKTADNPTSLVGAGIDFLVLDEAARLKREIWFGHLSQRLIDKKGWALLLSTPRGLNWFRQVYKRGQAGRDPDFESWSSPSWTNPHLSRSLIEAERDRLPDGSFQQEYEALFIGVDREACERCGWPDPMACTVTILKDEDEVLPTCVDCERLVNAEGHTIMGRTTDGQAYHTEIVLQPYGPGVPRPPLPVEDPTFEFFPPLVPEDRGEIHQVRM